VRATGVFEIFLALGVAALAGCARSEGPTASAPRPRVRSSIVVTAVIAEGLDDARRLLAPSLASGLGAADLGPMESERAARAAARAAGAEHVLVCRVAEYDPYDPQRLVLELALVDVAAGRLSAEDVMSVGMTPALPRRARPREAILWAARAEIDAASDEMLRAFAVERGLAGIGQDLLEASILIRDPERFFPFAARRVASRVPVGTAGSARADKLAARP
jgi:hypothetical protein